MSEKKILLGFEVPSGEPFHLNLHHLVITGMTELSGKTTAIEALIQRSGLRAIVFKTKRGEKGFERVGRSLPLYFKERSDWQYVSSLIEATLREKMKFERSWIIRACKGAKTLRDVYARVKEFLKKERLRSLDRSIFTNLQAYLELVLPSIEQLDFTDKLDMGPGVNVMDLEDLYAKPEVQALVIRSVMEYILEFERDIIVVVPECWKFLPQARGSPVKIFFERFIREGAAINNYLWLDSQDIAGVDKTPLRQVDNWILGRQKETHEVERTIDAIPLPKTLKPKPLQIRRLKVGHFIAACGDKVKLVYVLPAGVPEKVGCKVAHGKLSPEQVRDQFLLRLRKEDEELYKRKYEELLPKYDEAQRKLGDLLAEIGKPREHEKKLENRNKLLEAKVKDLAKRLEKAEEDLKLYDELQSVLRRMVRPPGFEPGISEVSVEKTIPKVTVNVKAPIIAMDESSWQGRLALLIAEGFFNDKRKLGAVQRELERRGYGRGRPATISNELTKLCAMHLLERRQESGSWSYFATQQAKEHVKKEADGERGRK